MTVFVPKEYEGKILRDFLRTECGVSHGMLVRLKKLPFGILLNGERVTVRAVLRENDIVDILTETLAEEENPLVDAVGEMPEILYEDEAMLAVNKPAGMPTHTSHGHRDDTLSNRVCAYFKKRNIPFVFRAINRLDRDTSGVVLIAKNAFYAARLSKFLSEGRFEKSYIALLDGGVDVSGKIEGYIIREEKSIIKRSFSQTFSEGADYSLTEYEKIHENNGISAVKIALKTGRTHQIRVHFAAVGAPVLGDTLYGRESGDISRQALHACTLSLPSPISGENVTLSAPLPEDILSAIRKNGLKVPNI